MRADAATLRLAVFPRVGLAADTALVLAAAVTGYLAERGWDRRFSSESARC